MTRDLDPERESALRRRLASFGDAIAVPPPTDGSGEGSGDGLTEATHPTDLALVRNRPDQPRRQDRQLVLAAAAATVLVAAAVGALTLTRGEGDDTEATSATTASTASSAGTPTTEAAALGSCEPRVAEDGVIASGSTEGDSGWQVTVSGAPPHVATSVTVDGASVGGTMNDEMSRAPLVNNGAFSLSAGLSDQGGIIYGEIPRASALVEVTTTDGTTLTACPVTVPTDELIAWFGLALPPDVLPADARALDATGQALASGGFETDGPFSVEFGGSYLTYLTADPALVDLPLGGTELELPPEVERTEILSGTAGNSPWTLSAALDRERVDVELTYEGGAMGFQVGPVPLAQETDWSLQEIGDRLVVWGPAPADVTTVTVGLDDGTTTDLATVSALADGSARAFAGTLPEGTAPTAIEGRRADGTTVLQVVDVAAGLAALEGDSSSSMMVARPPG